MSLEVTGKLLVKYDTQQVSDKFKKREFVLELAEEINGNIYTNFAKMQLVQNKCDIIDRFKEGETVRVSFNIKGNKWERDGKVNYITNLDAWRMESASSAPDSNNSGQQQQQQSAPVYNNNGGNNAGASNFNSAGNFNPSPESIDDLPF
jgi:single-stranded DNA-binding protein